MFQRFIKDYVLDLPNIDTLVGLKECRVWLINAMMLFVLIALPIAMISNFSIFSQKEMYPLIVIDLALYAMVAFGFFSKKGTLKIVPYLWIFLVYTMLIMFFFFLGPHYARSAWLVMVAVMAALFFGTWGAVISTAMNACVLNLIYFLVTDNNGAWVGVLKEPIQEWIMFIVNVSLVTFISSFPLGFLLKRLDLSLNHEKEISKDLVSRNRELKALEETRHDGFGDEVKSRILIGNFTLSAGNVGEYYGAATHVRNEIRADYERIFKDVDLILMPTHPIPAFPFDTFTDNKLELDLQDYFTCSANLAHVPALSFPCGFTKTE